MLNSLFQHFKKLDWILISAAFLLVALGLVFIYSSSLQKQDFSSFTKQIIFSGLGFVIMFSLSFFDWRTFKENSYLILTLYFICLILLTGLFFFAPVVRGVRAWYKIGNFSLDPIEPTKIVLIILLAKYFASRHVEMYRIRHIFLSGFYIVLPSILIFFQPNLGSVLLLTLFWIGMLVISGIKIKHFFILSLCGILILTLSWIFLMKDYQKIRIMSFLSPEEPLGRSWNKNQAQIAIGGGGLLGQGIGKGSQIQHGFLPEPKTDFIFAVLAEETGLIGVVFLLLLFSIIFWRTIRITIISGSNFPRLFGTGFAILLISQLFINIGMNLGILPIIGIPLPLVSYGGANLISTLLGIGILLSIRKDFV